MQSDLNTANRWEVNTLPVNAGFPRYTAPTIDEDVEVTPSILKQVIGVVDTQVDVMFRCSLANLFSYFYPLYNENVEFNADILNKRQPTARFYNNSEARADVIKGITVYVDVEEDAEFRLRDWSDADEVRVDVDIWEPVGIKFDNYIQTTFYPIGNKSNMSCPVVIRRPINPEPFESTVSFLTSSALKQWCYYISNTSQTIAPGTVGVVSDVVINGQTSMRAMGSLITDNNGVQIRNNSEMEGGEAAIYVNGYLKLDLHSGDCCVYPEAQTEEDIDCNVNDIHK